MNIVFSLAFFVLMGRDEELHTLFVAALLHENTKLVMSLVFRHVH
jgi:hypothetical protein